MKKAKHWKKDGGQFRAGSVKEKEILREIQRFTQKSRTGESFALCTVSRNDYSVAYGGENDFNRHKDASKHKGYVEILFNNKKLTNFGASLATTNLDHKVVKAKLLFSAFLVEHELPLTSPDHSAKIFRNMFPDFKIMNKYRYGRTKTTHC